MEKKLHLKKLNKAIIVLVLTMFGISNTSQSQQLVGTSLDGNFNTSGNPGFWSTQNAGATGTVSGGNLNMTMALQGNGKYRADIWYNYSGVAANDIILNSTNDAYLAIKFRGVRPAGGSLKFEMLRVISGSSTAWDNSSWNTAPDGSFTDANGDTIYYFQLTKDTDFTGGNLTYRTLHIIVADSPTTSTYSVDWIATFVSTAAIQTYMTATLATNDYQIGSNDLMIYPNPSNGNSFNLDLGNLLSGSDIKNVKIYNFLGQLVQENNLTSNSSTIQVNHNLKAGVYLVKVNNKANVKLVVK